MDLHHFHPALVKICKLGQGAQFAIRGTTSLVLQGYNMGLQDIDILANRGAAEILDRGLSDFCVSPLAYSQTANFKSYFGKYLIDSVPVEIMGEWQIKNGGAWSEVFDARANQITHINSLPVTTASTELRCYQLMNRWSTYHKLKKQLKP
jgi:hypothetical protein